MSQVNNYLDLNLLRVFLAIWDLRSLTAGGDRLGLTQPAISHALRRLRERFGDPLFLRGANRILPPDAPGRFHEPLYQASDLLNPPSPRRAPFAPPPTHTPPRLPISH